MEGTISEIRYFGPNWSPRNWFQCSGQLLSIAQFTAFFSLIGTIYGGDGRTTFGVPDLRGRSAVGAGSGPGRTPRINGQAGGVEYVTLNVLEMPIHNHAASISGAIDVDFKVSDQGGTASTPVAGMSLGAEAAPSSFIYNNETPNTTLNAESVTVSAASLQSTIGLTGGSQSHQNMQPWLALTPIICYQGIFPSRS